MLEMKHLITVKEAAGILGLTRQRVYIFVREGRIASKKYGHFLLVDRRDVRRFQRNRQK